MLHQKTSFKGFSLLELLVVVVIISALALIASPYLTGASSKAKLSAVKGNVASGAVSASVFVNLDSLSPKDVVTKVIRKGNYPDSKGQSDDESGDTSNQYTPSPFDASLKAYGGKGPGQVDVVAQDDPAGILLQGYDGKGNPIPGAKKFVPADDDSH